MNPIRSLLAGLLLAPLATLHGVDAEPTTKPNLILIVADDLGYGDPGCYGGKLAPTPAIDSLARDGVRFTDGYVTAPVCAPSRCGILTGAYNQRFGMQWNEDEWPPRNYVIPPGHLTLPEALRAAGYLTGHLGKWNIPRPAQEAVDEAQDLIGFEADYFPDATGHFQGVDEKVRKNSGKVQGVAGPERLGDEYLTDRLGRHAVEFIERHKHGKKPFFLYLAFNAPHSPYHAKKSTLEKFSGLQPPLNYYAAMVASMDENIARVLAKLKEAGLADNTVVAFTSDNGPTAALRVGWNADWPANMIVGSAGPLSGHKARFFEGGIREPFILCWPAKLKAGQTYRQPVSAMDFYATFCAAAGAPVPAGTKLDGVNLLPHLLGEKTTPPHEILFWKNGDQGAVRQGDWKLILSASQPRLQLFNLAQDIGEKHDLATENPDLVKQLHKAWLDWSVPLPPRANPPSGMAGQRKTSPGS
jgi:arylsulfatase A-like enzyme